MQGKEIWNNSFIPHYQTIEQPTKLPDPTGIHSMDDDPALPPQNLTQQRENALFSTQSKTSDGGRKKRRQEDRNTIQKIAERDLKARRKFRLVQRTLLLKIWELPGHAVVGIHPPPQPASLFSALSLSLLLASLPRRSPLNNESKRSGRFTSQSNQVTVCFPSEPPIS